MVTHHGTVTVHIGDTTSQWSSVSIGDPNEGRTVLYGELLPSIHIEGFMRNVGLIVPRKPKRQPKPGKRPYVPAKQLERWERR